MIRSSLRIISEEHQALSAILESLLLMAKRSSAETTANDFEVMRAMMFYVMEFPEKLHHTKETEILFPMVAARSPETRSTIKMLDEQHARGEAAVQGLMHRLIAWEMMGDSRHQDFLEAVTAFVEFYRDHMRTETTVVLPAAERILSDADWDLLDREFEANRDPLTGHAPDVGYQLLFTKILSNAPQPIGLGRV